MPHRKSSRDIERGKSGGLRGPLLPPDMELRLEHPAEEIKRLQRCISDLVSTLALPAVWSGSEPSEILNTLVNFLLRILRLEFVYVKYNGSAAAAASELVRVAQSLEQIFDPIEIRTFLHRWLGDGLRNSLCRERIQIGPAQVSVLAWPLGLQGEIGVIVVGSHRVDFPLQTETLLLSISANQVLIGLQEARLLSEQREVARELDQRVTQRTRELAEANEELRKEIADRKRAEGALVRSEVFLAEGQQLARMGNFSWNVVTDGIVWSEQLYRIFEIDPDVRITLELIGSRVYPEDIRILNDMISRARSGASDFEYEYRLLMPDDSVKHLHLIAQGSRNTNGQLEYLGAVQDVTRRRLAEEALGKVRSELAHAARVTTLGALTASIAHEVNQPLTAVANNANACLNLLPGSIPDLQEVRSALTEIIEDADRASAVVARVRQLVRNEPFTKTLLNLKDIVADVSVHARHESAAQHITIRSDLSADLPLVMADRVQLQQVLLNLVVNGMDAMRTIPEPDRILTICAKSGVRGGKLECLVSVHDAGIGIEQGEVGKLFEPFYTTKSHGMGMGLAICRSIIETHGGRLWVEPNHGAGATFLFNLPAEGTVPHE